LTERIFSGTGCRMAPLRGRSPANWHSLARLGLAKPASPGNVLLLAGKRKERLRNRWIKIRPFPFFCPRKTYGGKGLLGGFRLTTRAGCDWIWLVLSENVRKTEGTRPSGSAKEFQFFEKAVCGRLGPSGLVVKAQVIAGPS